MSKEVSLEKLQNRETILSQLEENIAVGSARGTEIELANLDNDSRLLQLAHLRESLKEVWLPGLRQRISTEESKAERREIAIKLATDYFSELETQRNQLQLIKEKVDSGYLSEAVYNAKSGQFAAFEAQQETSEELREAIEIYNETITDQEPEDTEHESTEEKINDLAAEIVSSTDESDDTSVDEEIETPAVSELNLKFLNTTDSFRTRLLTYFIDHPEAVLTSEEMQIITGNVITTPASLERAVKKFRKNVAELGLELDTVGRRDKKAEYALVAVEGSSLEAIFDTIRNYCVENNLEISYTEIETEDEISGEAVNIDTQSDEAEDTFVEEENVSDEIEEKIYQGNNGDLFPEDLESLISYFDRSSYPCRDVFSEFFEANLVHRSVLIELLNPVKLSNFTLLLNKQLTKFGLKIEQSDKGIAYYTLVSETETVEVAKFIDQLKNAFGIATTEVEQLPEATAESVEKSDFQAETLADDLTEAEPELLDAAELSETEKIVQELETLGITKEVIAHVAAVLVQSRPAIETLIDNKNDLAAAIDYINQFVTENDVILEAISVSARRSSLKKVIELTKVQTAEEDSLVHRLFRDLHPYIYFLYIPFELEEKLSQSNEAAYGTFEGNDESIYMTRIAWYIADVQREQHFLSNKGVVLTRDEAAEKRMTTAESASLRRLEALRNPVIQEIKVDAEALSEDLEELPTEVVSEDDDSENPTLDFSSKQLDDTGNLDQDIEEDDDYDTDNENEKDNETNEIEKQIAAAFWSIVDKLKEMKFDPHSDEFIRLTVLLNGKNYSKVNETAEKAIAKFIPSKYKGIVTSGNKKYDGYNFHGLALFLFALEVESKNWWLNRRKQSIKIYGNEILPRIRPLAKNK